MTDRGPVTPRDSLALRQIDATEIVKQAVQNEKLNNQMNDLHKQLEKSRKDYTKLLNQVGEDEDENRSLRD
jgi:hypothetical protein